MNYHNIYKDDMLNGEGLRVTLFVSGCTHFCKGCHNPDTWDENSGIPFDDAAKKELFDILSKDYIDGITLSGGDPLAVFNRSEVTELLADIKDTFPDKTAWIYTGYEFEDICEEHFLEYADVIVCGPFLKEKADTEYPYAGSTNQRIMRKRNNKWEEDCHEEHTVK